MVNQQLSDYVNGQLKLGVSKEAVRSALLDAGWPSADVKEVLGDVVLVRPMDAVKPAAPISSAASSPIKNYNSTEPIVVPTRVQPAAGPQIKFFENTPKKTEKQITEPLSLNSVITPHSTAKLSWKHRLAHMVMGIIILALGATGASLFIKNSNLAEKLGVSDREVSVIKSDFDALKNKNAEFEAKIQSLETEKTDAETHLKFFFSESGATANETVKVTGVISKPTGKNPYTLTTARGMVITLKNSREAAVEELLIQRIGTNVDLIVTHNLGSREAVIVEINGAKIPSSTVSTSTVPKQ